MQNMNKGAKGHAMKVKETTDTKNTVDGKEEEIAFGSRGG